MLLLYLTRRSGSLDLETGETNNVIGRRLKKIYLFIFLKLPLRYLYKLGLVSRAYTIIFTLN